MRSLLRASCALLSVSVLAACGAPIETDGGVDASVALPDVVAMDAPLRRDTGTCEDNDNDGHPSAACGGDDCDDNNPRRNPGVREVCDALGNDEDCDPCTVAQVTLNGRGGDGDRDEDGFWDRNCFNRIAPGSMPRCSGATPITDAGADAGVTVSRVRVMDSLVTGTDCADDPAAGGGTRFPGAAETCNMKDDDCDDVIDGIVLPCSTACGSGTIRCEQGAAATCSAQQPSIEVCNGRDDDCDPARLVDNGAEAQCPMRDHARAACTMGRCTIVCERGYADCNGIAEDGCEVATTSDPDNCDRCGNRCPVPAGGRATCIAGLCGAACPSPQVACGSRCINLTGGCNPYPAATFRGGFCSSPGSLSCNAATSSARCDYAPPIFASRLDLVVNPGGAFSTDCLPSSSGQGTSFAAGTAGCFMMRGPNWGLPAGRYRVEVDVAIRNFGTSTVNVPTDIAFDVFSTTVIGTPLTRLFATMPGYSIDPGERFEPTITIDFTLTAECTNNVQFRAFSRQFASAGMNVSFLISRLRVLSI